MVMLMLRPIGSGMKIELLNSLVHNIRTQFASLGSFGGFSSYILLTIPYRCIRVCVSRRF